MLVCLGGGGRIDSIRKGRKRDKQEKSDAPTKVQGQSILTLGKSVSSQCLTQFRSLFPCQVFWRLIPFRACCDHAYGRNILATLRGNFLGQLVLVVIIINHTSINIIPPGCLTGNRVERHLHMYHLFQVFIKVPLSHYL